MDTIPPEKPPLIAQLDPGVKRELDKIFAEARKHPPAPKPLQVENYGPIKSMLLGKDWTDVGIWPKPKNPNDDSHGGYRYKRHAYRLLEDDCTFSVAYDPRIIHDSTAAFVKELVSTTTGPVPKAQWDKIEIFDMSANPRFVTVESIEVVPLAGKKMIVMTNQLIDEERTRARHFLVSLSGNWDRAHHFVFAGPADREKFERGLEKFNNCLKTLVWNKEESRP